MTAGRRCRSRRSRHLVRQRILPQRDDLLTYRSMDLLFLLNQATFALSNEMASRLAEVELSPRKYCVLSRALQEDLTQIRLAEASMLDKTTMVVTLDEPVKAGLAERRPSPEDRRARIVRVPPKGAAAVAAGSPGRRGARGGSRPGGGWWSSSKRSGGGGCPPSRGGPSSPRWSS